MGLLNEKTWLIIVIGSMIGAIKANFLDRDAQGVFLRICNTIVSTFCGVAVAGHYCNNLTAWLSGLLALTSSMLSVVILETMYLLAPNTAKTIIKWYFSLNKKS